MKPYPLILILCLGCTPSGIERIGDARIEKVDEPFDWHGFLALKKYDGGQIDIQKPWLYLYYYDHLTCRNCANKELLAFRDFHKSQPKNVDCFIIVPTGQPYLKDLVRMSRMRDRILLAEPAVYRPYKRLALSLIDTAASRTVLRYFPHPDPETEPLRDRFQSRLLALTAEMRQ
ncbi:MAG: hypothetical protein QNK37_03795 [Acidobacteriota bacterium]|nr:hypothetical protein [Acidobacteriota bacterium]